MGGGVFFWTVAYHYSHSGYLVYGERPYLHVGYRSLELISTPSSPIVNMEYMVKEITLGKPPPLSAPIRVSVPYQSVLKQMHCVLCDPTVAFIILPSPYHQLPVPLGSPVRYYVGQAPQCLAVPWLVQVGGGTEELVPTRLGGEVFSTRAVTLHAFTDFYLSQLFPTCSLPISTHPLELDYLFT